jgi:S1-C subfamily serine protease
MSRRQVPVVLLSTVLGAALAVGVIAVGGLGGSTTTQTVVQQAPLSAAAESGTATGNASGGGSAQTTGLTASQIYKQAAPGVVYIKADVVQQAQDDSPFGFGQQEQEQGTATGSGFVVDKQGDILTNAHVVAGAVKVTVGLQDKRTVAAKVIGKDTSTDLALLKIDPAGLNLQPLQLGSSKGLQVGDPVVAIGNPFGLDRTLTTGVVSALQREISAPNGFSIDNVIQTDAAINPGNSGGPLIDASGEVVGINSQIETGGSDSEGNVGIGFAVPIDTARAALNQLKTTGHIAHAYLGIQSVTVDSSLASLNLRAKQGALVQSVQQGSPADKAGVKAGTTTAQLQDGTQVAMGGDVITRLAGKAVTTADDLTSAIAGKSPGQKVQMTVVHNDGKQQTLTVTLGDRPDTTTTSQSQP